MADVADLAPDGGDMAVVPAGNPHRIDVEGRVDFHDGSRRVLFSCVVTGCARGHVELTPADAADEVVRVLAEVHPASMRRLETEGGRWWMR